MTVLNSVLTRSYVREEEDGDDIWFCVHVFGKGFRNKQPPGLHRTPFCPLHFTQYVFIIQKVFCIKVNHDLDTLGVSS